MKPSSRARFRSAASSLRLRCTQERCDGNVQGTAMITNQATVTSKAGQSHYASTSLYDRSGEQALVAAAQAGVADAMNELLVRHKTALYRAARRFTRSHEDAEDLVQDAM